MQRRRTQSATPTPTSNCDRHCHSNQDCHRDRIGDADPIRDCNGDQDRYVNGQRNTDRDSIINGDPDRIRDRNGDQDRDTDCDGNTNCHRNPNRDTNGGRGQAQGFSEKTELRHRHRESIEDQDGESD